MVASDPDWGLQRGWYGEGNQWRTFNEFFSRRLVSPDVRPIADVEVVSPADSWPKSPYDDRPTTTWHIGDDNQLEYPAERLRVGKASAEGILQIKTAKITDIAQLIGEDSQYKDAFAGGTLTHTFLNVNDYHRYHSPVSGTLLELRNIPGVAAGGGYTLWDNEKKLYYYHNNIGFQMVGTRSCAIIEHDLKIGRPVFEVMRILGKSALTTDSIQDLFKPLKETAKPDDGQLYFDFKFD